MLSSITSLASLASLASLSFFRFLAAILSLFVGGISPGGGIGFLFMKLLGSLASHSLLFDHAYYVYFIPR